MAIISKITSTRPFANYKSVVTTAVKNGKFYQYGKTVSPGNTTFRELYVQGHDFFQHISETVDKNGKVIKGSRYSENIIGPEANKRRINNFGVDA